MINDRAKAVFLGCFNCAEAHLSFIWVKIWEEEINSRNPPHCFREDFLIREIASENICGTRLAHSLGLVGMPDQRPHEGTASGQGANYRQPGLPRRAGNQDQSIVSHSAWCPEFP